MDELDLINIDYFKKSYYKALLPLPQINEFLKEFESREIDTVTKTLIALFDVSITKTLLLNLEQREDQEEFLRLIQNDYTNPAIFDFLTDKFPGSEELIKQTLERTLLSAKKAIL